MEAELVGVKRRLERLHDLAETTDLDILPSQPLFSPHHFRKRALAQNRELGQSSRIGTLCDAPEGWIGRFCHLSHFRILTEADLRTRLRDGHRAQEWRPVRDCIESGLPSPRMDEGGVRKPQGLGTSEQVRGRPATASGLPPCHCKTPKDGWSGSLSLLKTARQQCAPFRGCLLHGADDLEVAFGQPVALPCSFNALQSGGRQHIFQEQPQGGHGPIHPFLVVLYPLSLDLHPLNFDLCPLGLDVSLGIPPATFLGIPPLEAGRPPRVRLPQAHVRAADGTEIGRRVRVRPVAPVRLQAVEPQLRRCIGGGFATGIAGSGTRQCPGCLSAYRCILPRTSLVLVEGDRISTASSGIG